MTTYDDGFFDAGRKYFEHGLPAWKHFVLNDLKAKSIADFGCGQGDWLEPFVGTIPVWGCDGYADEKHLRIPTKDFTKLMLGDVTVDELGESHFDVVMSLEAMEHVPASKENNFFDCMLSPEPRLVVFSVASGWGTYDPTQFKTNRMGEQIPGGPDWHMQWGRHHVACQPVEVVIEKMAHRGYIVDEDFSKKFSQLRAPGATVRGRCAFASFYRKNTRIYRRANG